MKSSREARLAAGDGTGSHQVEQALCRRALESHTYDTMSDRAWVALCERVNTEARRRGRDADRADIAPAPEI